MSLPLAIVTGAAGWLGARLVETLVRGLPDVPALATPSERAVRALVLPGTEAARLLAASPRVEVVPGDVTDPGSLGPLFRGAAGATVFHVAGVVHPTRGIRELHAVNVDGTRHVAEAARRAGVRRLIHVSSNSPLGIGRDPDDVFDEERPYHPYMGYGRSKMLAETIVRAADAALETVVVRPPWFYGPGHPPRQSLFIEMVRDGRAPLVGPGTNRRSMAYLDNICQGLMLAEQVARARGQTYWIADREPYAMRTILDTIEEVLAADFGVAVARRRLRLPGVASVVARGLDATLQSIGLYHPKIHVLSEMNATIACTVAKAERELGYAPTVALREGMRRSIAWMLSEGRKL